MSAESLGKDLLGEIEEESLDALLRSLKSTLDPAPPELGIAAIDKLLKIFQPPLKNETPRQSTNWSPETPISNPEPAKEYPPPVIEITGASPCSGKTQLLYHLITITLLPPLYNDIHLAGKEQAVVLLDLSTRFSLPRLKQIMSHYISTKPRPPSSSPPLNESQTTTLIHSTLTHLHVFRSHSTQSLLATLTTLPTYLLAQPSLHFSANRSVGLLAISDLSAFYHQDRQRSEETSITTNATQTPSKTLLHQSYTTLTTTLRSIQLLFSTPLIATNHALHPLTNRRTPTPSLRPHLPSTWNNFCTLQVVVERDRVTKFSPGMSVEEASREKGQRWDAVQRSGFSGWVNWWGSGGWREEVKEGLRGVEGGGRFRFWVGGGGVAFQREEEDEEGEEDRGGMESGE